MRNHVDHNRYVQEQCRLSGIKADEDAWPKVGAVLVFKTDDLQRIQRWLDRAADAGVIEQTTAHGYDERHGGPVWYIP